MRGAQFLLGLRPELILLLSVGLGLSIVAFAWWTSGRDIRKAEISFSTTMEKVRTSYREDRAETLKLLKASLSRQKEIEDELISLKKTRTMERYKLTDEEFWEQVDARDQKIEKCKEGGHFAIPTRRGWGIICVRKEAVVWSE